jgi:hypothetical protein
MSEAASASLLSELRVRAAVNTQALAQFEISKQAGVSMSGKTTFVRINNIIANLQNVERLSLEESTLNVNLYVSGRAEPYRFSNKTRDEAISFFLDLSKSLQNVANQVYFFYFATTAIRLDLLSAFAVDGKSIVVSSKTLPEEVFTYETEEAAFAVYDELLKVLGIIKPVPTKKPAPKTNARIKTKGGRRSATKVN